MENEERFKACLLGGAIGDALGYPVEFMSLEQIRTQYGPEGITRFTLDKYTKKALVSDDTQMTLFTADGIVRGYERCSERGIGSFVGSGVYPAYLRWLYTQTGRLDHEHWLRPERGLADAGRRWILDVEELHARRAPGLTCLSALESGKVGTMEQPLNDSKGCGGVMRVAPVGLFLYNDPEYAFRTGCEVAALTHGHPTGYLAAGALALMIAELLNGNTMEGSASSAIQELTRWKQSEETLAAMEQAMELAGSHLTAEDAISRLGEGWIAEEALAIALYSTLREEEFTQALAVSVNHNGDSDSTGAICGNLLGARDGMAVIPATWLSQLEMKDFIEEIADTLLRTCERKNHR